MVASDLDRLTRVLDEADLERGLDVEHLADLTPEQVAYLADVGEAADPVTDGLEGECV